MSEIKKKSWKVEMWLEDIPPAKEENGQDSLYLSQDEINFAVSEAKEAIENQWGGLKVIVVHTEEEVNE